MTPRSPTPSIDATMPATSSPAAGRMQIVVPMSGFGERFRRAGYALPKPLIPVDGRPIIGHVVDMFPGETDFIFVCNADHLAHPDYRMAETLAALCPTGRIVAIPSHRLGPVHAVMHAADLLDPARPVVVNYCDFSCYWDWPHFVDFVRRTGCDGAIPAYRGFHPHSLGTTNYAYMREQDGWALDIQEKKPYTDDPMQEHASSGTYYFSSARKMLAAFAEMRRQDLSLGGEFYVSLAYKPLLQQGDAIAVYELQHFLQWGTPDDLREYAHWSRAFERLARTGRDARAPARGALVVPMAGLGERFARVGYATPKPLIEVSGRPMAIQAALDLPASAAQAFVLRADMPGCEAIVDQLTAEFPGALTPTIASVTEGQACTADIGLQALRQVTGPEAEAPVTFGACDCGTLFDAAELRRLLDEQQADVVIWAARRHPHAARHPEMYGWVDAQGDAVRAVSVKKPLADPANDPIVIGMFTFRSAAVFAQCYERMRARDGRVNGEFYLDTCANDALALGLRCAMLEVDAYFSWGTPNDLKTFEYWQSCFHKLARHPYTLEADARVPAAARDALARRYRAQAPALPAPLAAREVAA